MRKLLLLMLAFLCLYSTGILAQQIEQDWVEDWPAQPGSKAPSRKSVLVAPDGNIVITGANVVCKYRPDGLELYSHVLNFPNGFEPRSLAMAIDNQGNIYVTALDVHIDETKFTGKKDIYVAKISSSGTLLWTRWYDGTLHFNDVATAIDVDQFGNVYITGGTQAAVDPIYNMVTIKYNTAGDLKWIARHFGLNSLANSIVVDYYTGDVFIGGRKAVTGNGSDFTVIKYNTNGEQKWIHTFNGDGTYGHEDVVHAITIDNDGNPIATGFSTQTYESSCCGDQDVKVINTMKYDRNSGTLLWHKKYGDGQENGSTDAFHAEGYAIAIDPQDNVYLTGYITHEDDGRKMLVTVKYTKTGSFAWHKRYSNQDYIPWNVSDDDREVGFALTYDGHGSMIVVGYTKREQTDLHDFITLKYRCTNGEQTGIRIYDETNDDRAVDVAVDNVGNVYVTGDADGITLIKYVRCMLACREDVTTNNDAGQCGAIVEYLPAYGFGDCGTPTYSHASGSFFPVGTTIVLVTAPETGDTCTFKVKVNDIEVPVITCPANLTVSCKAEVPPVNPTGIVATDNCGAPVVTHISDVVSDSTCANRYTITRTYKATDASGNSATCVQVIRVQDNTPPQINNMTISQTALWPPNHTMRDITVSYDVLDNCVLSPQTTISITSNEPVNGTADGDTDPDWEIIDLHHIRLRAERASNGSGRIYTITVTVDDGCNPPVTQSKQVMVAHNITGPHSGHPFKVGSTVNFGGTFQDAPGMTHTAKWLVDGSTAANGQVTEPEGLQAGKVTGSYKFTTPGVYKLQMNVTNNTGVTSYVNTFDDIDALVVIYDPNGGNAFGGGWFQSPAGALTTNSSATGKASYGFAVNYRNTAKPKGETQFEFKVGGFEFNALNFDYLAIGNVKAQFKGTGKIIGGQSGVGFIMTVIDGAVDGTGVDKIRMKIYNRNTGFVYYDNQRGSHDAADPVMAVGDNSTIVVQGSQVNSAMVTEAEHENKVVIEPMAFDIKAYPNPSDRGFNLVINGTTEQVQFKCYDVSGRLVEQSVLRSDVIFRFGETYRPGIYIVQVWKGKEMKSAKLVKK
jgi:hypothetical protein